MACRLAEGSQGRSFRHSPGIYIGGGHPNQAIVPWHPFKLSSWSQASINLRTPLTKRQYFACGFCKKTGCIYWVNRFQTTWPVEGLVLETGQIYSWDLAKDTIYLALALWLRDKRQVLAWRWIWNYSTTWRKHKLNIVVNPYLSYLLDGNFCNRMDQIGGAELGTLWWLQSSPEIW